MKKKQPSHSLIICSILGFLTISAFCIRLQNFKNNNNRTIDEIVYYRMSKQIVNQGLSGYNTIPYGKELQTNGRDLPKYFFQPLFKHPPVFSLLASVSIKIFGKKLIAAEYISLLASVLMIPLIYLLGALISDKKVGLLAAGFLWLDPISIICSQKVWMDTTIAFFTLLAALFFVQGLKQKKDFSFFLSGIATGLATNTKYTGFLITLIIALFASIYRRDLFKNKKFQLSLILPIILLTPWLYWNYQTYGLSFITKNSELTYIFNSVLNHTKTIISLLLGTLMFILLYKKINHLPLFNKTSSNIQPINEKQTPIKYVGILITIAFFIFIIPEQLWHSLQFTYLPTHTWKQGFSSGEPPSFYFGRLIEFSFLYAFSFLSIFLYKPDEDKETSFIRLSAVLILLFFIKWGNFQSRYILSAIPFLILLGVQSWTKIFEKISASDNNAVYYSGRMIMRLILAYTILKTFYLNNMLSYTNDMCYF